ncbi:hypothetical protein K432DRAFT_380819 [Lepidopterella palustris CBS 459.81]|uniref:Uncharacterized protein n=1 Tax=Lepidopterella palustris CBS 459.81 TaxID=1314670 RepID=A0A8E2EDF8_9PEZI|nr:hypothetical protein K432DRAFT_380819 [Lepidopterella palustris CBS 459.81]
METSLPALLSSLTASLESAVAVLPDETVILPPKEGISLLDVKNELLVSYLQNLVFLILLKLRSRCDRSELDIQNGEGQLNSKDEVVKKLVELRVFLEKGVRPLEGRLKYQIDKVIRAADDSARSAAHNSGDHKRQSHSMRHARNADEGDNPEAEGSGYDSDGSSSPAEQTDELSYRPNPSAFLRAKPSAAIKTQKGESNDGIYKPPRITQISMPTTSGREVKEARRPAKSATMDEFIATELSAAPIAEPSIGSTIVSGGRHTKSQKEREDEAERQAYEESNFVRLPKASKKDRAKKVNRSRDEGYGGEEWKTLGAGLDRIERMTQKRVGKSGALDNSRKRPIQDGPRGTGLEIGERFEKRRKTLPKSRKR